MLRKSTVSDYSLGSLTLALHNSLGRFNFPCWLVQEKDGQSVISRVSLGACFSQIDLGGESWEVTVDLTAEQIVKPGFPLSAAFHVDIAF